MGSREGSTMWTYVRDTVRDVWRFTWKPIVTHNLCSTSLLINGNANVSPCAVVQPLGEVDGYGSYIHNDWNKSVTGSGSDLMVNANGKKGSHWLVNLIGKEIGFKMSPLPSVVYSAQSVDDSVNQKQPLPVIFKEDNHAEPQGATDTTAPHVGSDSCTSAGFTLRKRLQGLKQYCHSWPISLAKTLFCSDWPALTLQFAQLSDYCASKQTYLSSSLSSKVLLYCGVQCNSSAMDKYQDLYHQNSWELCTNNSNSSVAGTPASADEVSLDGAGKMNHTLAMSSGNHIPAMLDRRYDSRSIQDSESFCCGSCICDMNSAMGEFVEHNCNTQLHSCAPVKLGSSRHNKMVDANLSALSKLCSACQVTDSRRILCHSTTCSQDVVQDQTSDENKGKKTKKTRPSAKKRRRLKQKREPNNHTPSGINKTLTAESQRSDKIRNDNLHVTMTVDHCADCIMEDKFVVISGISLNNFIVSPDTSDSDNDDVDGGFVDMDDAAALWDSFTNGVQLDPLSFQFTCTISTSTTALFSDVDFDISSMIHDANRKWNETYQEIDIVNNTGEDIQSMKVHFPARDTDLTEVHELTEWPEACTEARRGCWEEIARDRQRFGRRIQGVEELIGFCLTQAHRDIVYQTRFVDYFR